MEASGVGTTDQSLAAILSRNLNADVPVTLRAMFQMNERALVVFPSKFGAIVATDRRVIRERPNEEPAVYAFSQLTGAVAHVGVLSPFLSRYLALVGPGLPKDLSFAKAALSDNATMVEASHVGDARRAASEISRMVSAANGRSR
jgi:hypothetical protein